MIIEKEKEIQRIIVKISTLEEEKHQKQEVATELIKENEYLRSEMQRLSHQVEGGGNTGDNINRVNQDWERRL